MYLALCLPRPLILCLYLYFTMYLCFTISYIMCSVSNMHLYIRCICISTLSYVVSINTPQVEFGRVKCTQIISLSHKDRKVVSRRPSTHIYQFQKQKNTRYKLMIEMKSI